jgi:hypothetical protein
VTESRKPDRAESALAGTKSGPRDDCPRSPDGAVRRRFTGLRSLVLRNASWHRAASAIVLLLSMGLLGWKAYESWDALRAYQWQIRYSRLVPSFALYLLQTLIVVWAWQSIMNCLTQPLPLQKHARIYVVTHLLRRIPAGMLWVMAGRAYAYRESEMPVGTAAFGSVLETWLVISTGLPLAALATPALGLLSQSHGQALALAGCALNVITLHPSVINKILDLLRQESCPPELTYRTTLSWAVIYISIWLVSGTGLFAMAQLFTDLAIAHLPATIGVWVLSSLISYLTLLSPSGLGVKELSLTLLLGRFLADPLPLLIALAMRLLWTLYDVLFGLGALLL